MDDQDGIQDPVGMSRGAARGRGAHHHRRRRPRRKNICRSIQRAGLTVDDLVPPAAGLEPTRCWATTSATSASCCSTSAAAPPTWRSSSRARSATPRSCRSAGANVTNDIAIGLRTPIEQAEQIKIQHGCALRLPGPLASETVWCPGWAAAPTARSSRRAGRP